MIVRFKELDIEQLNEIKRGTLVFDYQMHPYVVIHTSELGWYLDDMTSYTPINMIYDCVPFFDDDLIKSYTYIEMDDIVAFADWNVIL